MPAGDAGLERQTDEPENFSANMEILALEAQRHWQAIKAVERERDDLRVQLAAQQAVVDAARELRDCAVWGLEGEDACLDRLDDAFIALDAQPAQPEDEW